MSNAKRPPRPGTSQVRTVPGPRYDTTMARMLRLGILLLCGWVGPACTGTQERGIEFVYLALGASDATGVGAVPLSEGYVYLIQRDLDRRLPRVLLLNLGVPGARTAVIMEQARLARQGGIAADLVTLWTGANDLISGEDPQRFRHELRALVSLVKEDLSDTVVMATLPDLTQLPRFRERPSPSVTHERLVLFNRVIAQEAGRAEARLVDLFASPMREELVFGPDGFHPNNAGHREIARLFLHAILPGLRLG